ncbi:3119_t:CDS:2 [Ambispora gerdemannii]|uniref:3119_t:CDS:1 n=1 Tax=Ambispora gerdemannii TaxID=144530 RepID=A0A9N8WTI1_9GLOM|nr:3119_t:CDS:2 [Ambispora gerdemannii]
MDLSAITKALNELSTKLDRMEGVGHVRRHCPNPTVMDNYRPNLQSNPPFQQNRNTIPNKEAIMGSNSATTTQAPGGENTLTTLSTATTANQTNPALLAAYEYLVRGRKRAIGRHDQQRGTAD